VTDPRAWPGPVLTVREREVAELLGHGLGYAEIAERLGVSDYMVRSRAKGAAVKLGLRNARNVAAWVRERAEPG
jgi:DNA-binding NarL/FixJ family response regulator